MNRATPVSLRSSLEAAHTFANAGIDFVCVPVLSESDRIDLVNQAAARFEQLIQNAEKNGGRPMSQSREQFEARYPVPAGVRWSEETSRYALVDIKTARHTGSTIAGYEAYVHSWGVWKASRQAVVVHLPPALRGLIDADDVRDEIEAVGLSCEVTP
ncbi:DUF1382 family protein [Pseudomonas sp. Irchel 3A18]|uniref:DUF1382 family protein n=1 Tax=Pseudomonas sp. Irchel 3A18 TaxID=2008905 RepID=UPI000BA3502E|nr:DUF1382 family protein [Pseudomonas sp. Irchel 3A18]